MTKFYLYCIHNQKLNSENNLVDCEVSPVYWKDVCDTMEKLYNYNGTVPNFYFDDMLPKALFQELGLSVRFSTSPETSLIKPMEEVFFVDKNSAATFEAKYKPVADMIAGTLVIEGFDVVVSHFEPGAIKEHVISKWSIYRNGINNIRKSKSI